MRKFRLTIFVISLTLIYFSSFSIASDPAPNPPLKLNLHSLLIDLIKNHEEIKSIKSLVEQAQAQRSQVKGLYFPTLNIIADVGPESINKEFASDTNETRYNVTLSANQLITDFGKRAETLKRSSIYLELTHIQLEANTQQLMLEGITAYINVVRARERLKSSRQSEARIKELTGIEKTLVDRGAGLSSDVLQAKSQLAGAMALRVEAQGELSMAINRFQATFFHFLTNKEVDHLETINFPYKKLPLELKDAIAIARKKSPELIMTILNSQLAQKDINIAKTAYYPQLNLFAKALTKNNDAGVIGYSNEASVGIELRYNIFNGGGDKAALRSAVAFKKSTTYHTEYVKRIIKEQVNNSWEQLSILKQRRELLNQQSDIVKNFLELAKKERTMGTRSLLEVLNGEINYINSLATSISAGQDTKIAAYNLLFAMGDISLKLFEN
jgi:outer membrane protein, adhesin transport system